MEDDKFAQPEEVGLDFLDLQTNEEDDYKDIGPERDVFQDKNVIIQGRKDTRAKALPVIAYPKELTAIHPEFSKLDDGKAEYLWNHVNEKFHYFMKAAGVKTAREMHRFILRGDAKARIGNSFLTWNKFLYLAAMAAFPNIKQNRHFIFDQVLTDVIIPLYKADKAQAANILKEKATTLEKDVAEAYSPRQKQFIRANKKLFREKMEA